MKKLFILAAAIVAFASCSKEPEAIVNDGSIKFAMAQTRAGVTTTENLADFTVYGYTENAKDVNIFNGVIASDADNNDVWTTAVTKYWAVDSTYNFFAFYAPTSADDKVNSNSVNVTNNIMTINFTNKNGEVDLVTAASKNVESLYNKSTNTTNLTFKHALARVAFQFQWDCNKNSGMTIEITDVKLLGTKGTGVLSVNEDGLQTWEPSGNNIEIAYAAPSSALSEAAPLLPSIDKTSGVGYQYIIPTTGLQPQIAFTAVVKDKEGQVLKTFNKSTGVNLPQQTYVAGSSYFFTMNINPNFSEIAFTVKVEEWGNVDGGTINFGNE